MKLKYSQIVICFWTQKTFEGTICITKALLHTCFLHGDYKHHFGAKTEPHPHDLLNDLSLSCTSPIWKLGTAGSRRAKIRIIKIENQETNHWTLSQLIRWYPWCKFRRFPRLMTPSQILYLQHHIIHQTHAIHVSWYKAKNLEQSGRG